MKILSYNVRGLGGLDKRKEVRRLVSEKSPFVLCIQESKMCVVNDFFATTVWGNSLCGYSFQASLGASGSLLTIWDTNVVEVWSTSRVLITPW